MKPEHVYRMEGEPPELEGDLLSAYLDEWHTSDELTMDHLYHVYREGGADFRAGIDAALISVVGRSMPSLIRLANKEETT